jgi:hypothetical protein
VDADGRRVAVEESENLRDLLKVMQKFALADRRLGLRPDRCGQSRGTESQATKLLPPSPFDLGSLARAEMGSRAIQI